MWTSLQSVIYDIELHLLSLNILSILYYKNKPTYMMVHQCRVQCHSVDPKTLELIGAEDEGKWMPFIFHMDIINLAKQSSDEEDSPTYNCTTIYTETGDTFIIDTPFEEFFKKFTLYNSIQIIDNSDEDNLEL